MEVKSENQVMQIIAKDLAAVYANEELNQQISGKIFDDCKPFKISEWDYIKDNAKRIQLMKYTARNAQILYKFLDYLGAEEHAADWDPSIKIILRNGQTKHTSIGYWDFKIIKSNLVFGMAPEDGELIIPIVAIRELSLTR